MTLSPVTVFAQKFRAELEPYQRGFPDGFRALAAEYESYLHEASSTDRHDGHRLTFSLFKHACLRACLPMLQDLAGLQTYCPMREVLARDCAYAGWRPGYMLLRPPQARGDLDLQTAFKMDDPQAYNLEQGADRIQEDVGEFFDWILTQPNLPLDDAIAFLKKVGVDWAVDQALGLRIRDPDRTAESQAG